MYFSRMSANENRATKAKHVHYQMSSVDHCHREDVPRRHSGGTVRVLFLFCFLYSLYTSLSWDCSIIRVGNCDILSTSEQLFEDFMSASVKYDPSS